jgi:general secretion pathway protein E
MAAGTRMRPQLPLGFASRFGVLARHQDGAAPVLIYRADTPLEALVEARRYLAEPVTIRQVERPEFDALMTALYERSSGEAMEGIEDIGDDLDLRQVADQLPQPEELLEADNDAPIIRLLNALLIQAVREGASDIHVEPFESRLAIRFRVDGVMREVLSPRRELAPLLVSRVKVMARLDIAEKRLPQDGRISLRIGGRAVDVRVATIPSGAGERVVLRLLDKQTGRMALDRLGLGERCLDEIERQIRKPHGILLVTGPTGSGKTTTLYGILSRLNDRTRSILTVEDPVEYYIDGIGQTQVNTRIDMSFARGLRAILRQDPDVVMVGEIRDLETAQIAVQASLTGHLVLSTLHTNTAVGAVTRLRDMGVEPFLLASSLVGVLAQRLVRLLCSECRQPYAPDAGEARALGLDPLPTLYRAAGCEQCRGTGYRGRTGIFEFIAIDETLKTLIHGNASEQELETYARSQAPGIRDDGRRRVIEGATTAEELFRVTQTD